MRTIILASETDFAGWRTAARAAALANVAPEDVHWSVGDPCDDLFAADSASTPATNQDAPGGVTKFTVPRAFVAQCAAASLHRDVDRFAFLYRLLWRVREEPELPCIAVDADVVRLSAMVKAVRRDQHKMKAYVRFRKVTVDAELPGARRSHIERARRDGDHFNVLEPWFVAWFEPTHHIVEAVAPFFQRRFTAMKWSILTPERSVHWDGKTLLFGPGAVRADAPDGDALEDLWRCYYANIFNPARLKLASMQGQMPKKYWKNLPEADLIAPLAAAARHRTARMIAADTGPIAPRSARVMRAAGHASRPEDLSAPAQNAVPDSNADLNALRAAARNCRACPLWEPATQTVFGEGPENASIVMVGEQPGDQEDLAGRPFIGPAGQLFDRALHEAGIARERLYVTNAVKHFKFIVRGKRRLHQAPKVTEIRACRPWLEGELQRIKPALIVALGATAAHALFGRTTPIEKNRGRLFEHAIGHEHARVMVTVHPSYLLRLPNEALRAEAYRNFVADLRFAAAAVENGGIGST